MKLTLKLIGITITSLTLAGCKPKPLQDESSTRSLDNFEAGAQTTRNECRGDFTKDLMDERVLKLIAEAELIKVPTHLASDLEQALSAAPTGLKNLFFAAGYRIEVEVGAKARCAKALEDETAAACGLPERIELENGEIREGLTVYIEANPSAIHHDTLRMLAYATSEQLARLQPGSDGLLEMDETDDPGFADWKARLVVAMLEDVATKRGITNQSFGKFRSLLPASGPLIASTSSLEERTKAWGVFAENFAADAQKFSTFAFAEALDSYWCDTALTRAKMETEFTKAHELFANELESAVLNSWDNDFDAIEGSSVGILSLWRFPILGAPFRAAARVGRFGARVISAPFVARSNLVGRVGSFPRLRSGMLFPRLWGR